MRFQCPYCHQSLGSEPAPHCPHCGKSIVIPGRYRKTSYRQREGMRRKVEREAERKRRELENGFPVPMRRFNPLLFLPLLLILGALLVSRSTSTAPQQAQDQEKQARQQAERELQVLSIALDRFNRDIGRYPTDEEGLKALVQNPGATNWQGHYISLLQPDPWDVPYQYTATNPPVVHSAGPDQIFGTPDDLFPDRTNAYGTILSE